MKSAKPILCTVFLYTALLVFAGCSHDESPIAVADTIYAGGPIVTVNDIQPNADAVAVLDGKILAVGALAEVSAHRGETKDCGYRNTKPVSTLSKLDCDAAELEFGAMRRSVNSRFWG